MGVHDLRTELLCLLVTLLSLMVVIYVIVDTVTTVRPEVAVTRPRPATRPQICAKYYNDGTDRWIDCMGVGYR